MTEKNKENKCCATTKVEEIRAKNKDCGEDMLRKEGNPQKNTVVVISSNQMGSGPEELGKTLLKGFIYALSQQNENTLPKTILFYNSGAFLTCLDSPSLEDLKSLKEKGVEILTCGTCLNYYKLTDKMQVGEVTNMYTITEKMTAAELVVKP